jgi:hypothetical protein
MDLGVYSMRYFDRTMRYMQPGVSQMEPFRCGSTLEGYIRFCLAEADFSELVSYYS